MVSEDEDTSSLERYIPPAEKYFESKSKVIYAGREITPEEEEEEIEENYIDPEKLKEIGEEKYRTLF